MSHFGGTLHMSMLTLSRRLTLNGLPMFVHTMLYINLEDENPIVALFKAKLVNKEDYHSLIFKYVARVVWLCEMVELFIDRVTSASGQWKIILLIKLSHKSNICTCCWRAHL